MVSTRALESWLGGGGFERGLGGALHSRLIAKSFGKRVDNGSGTDVKLSGLSGHWIPG